MVGKDPVQVRKEPVIGDNLPRAEGELPDVHAHVAPAASPRPLGGRRISFVAWGLAGLAGIALWILIFEIM